MNIVFLCGLRLMSIITKLVRCMVLLYALTMAVDICMHIFVSIL